MQGQNTSYIVSFLQAENVFGVAVAVNGVFTTIIQLSVNEHPTALLAVAYIMLDANGVVTVVSHVAHATRLAGVQASKSVWYAVNVTCVPEHIFTLRGKILKKGDSFTRIVFSKVSVQAFLSFAISVIVYVPSLVYINDVG
jgi:hypothetical protein